MQIVLCAASLLFLFDFLSDNLLSTSSSHLETSLSLKENDYRKANGKLKTS
jgi:hypothetical protein